jgi:hypothetical protein
VAEKLLINLKEKKMEIIQHLRTSALNQSNVLTFISRKKKAHYNLPNLYNSLKNELYELNRFNYCHLTTYPYIGVHVVNRDAAYLMDNHAEIKETVECLLWELQV